MRWPVVLILAGAGVFLSRMFFSSWAEGAMPILGPLTFWGGIALVVAGIVMDRRIRPTPGEVSYRPAWSRFWFSATCGALGALLAFQAAEQFAWADSLAASWAAGAFVALAGAAVLAWLPRREKAPMRRLDRAVTLWMWVPGFAVAWILLWFFSFTGSPTAAG